MKTLFLFLAVLITGCNAKGSLNAPSAPLPPIEKVPSPVLEPEEAPPTQITFTEEFMTLVNDHRNSLGLEPLLIDEDLSAISQAHTESMAKNKMKFSHKGFSERCSKAKEVLNGANLCGENVAQGQKTPAQAFRSWMNSPKHRLTIENPRYNLSGFGFAKDEDGGFYWNHLFLEKP